MTQRGAWSSSPGASPALRDLHRRSRARTAAGWARRRRGRAPRGCGVPGRPVRCQRPRSAVAVLDSLGVPALYAGAARAADWIRRHPALRRSRIAWKRALYAQRLRQVLEPLRPDLIHAHFGPHGVDAAIALEGASTPLVVDFHGYDITSFTQQHGWELYRAALGAAHLVAHSSFAQRVACGSRPDSVRVRCDGRGPAAVRRPTTAGELGSAAAHDLRRSAVRKEGA